MRAPFLAAAIQLRAGADRARNLAQAEGLVRAAHAAGAALVVLPEVFSWRGPKADEHAAAEPLPGPTSRWLTGLARELGIHLVGGSILERAPRGRRVFNTSLVADPRGRLVATYRKIHLFDVDLPGRPRIRESATRRPGHVPVVVTTSLARLGLSVCYDLRFPELYRSLALAGAEVLCVPSAFTAPTGQAHWEALLRARAIENQCYVVAPDQHGASPEGIPCHGHSTIVDPWGRVLARRSSGAGIVTAQIDPAVLAQVRTALPALTHVRLARPLRVAGASP